MDLACNRTSTQTAQKNPQRKPERSYSAQKTMRCRVSFEDRIIYHAPPALDSLCCSDSRTARAGTVRSAVSAQTTRNGHLPRRQGYR